MFIALYTDTKNLPSGRLPRQPTAVYDPELVLEEPLQTRLDYTRSVLDALYSIPAEGVMAHVTLANQNNLPQNPAWVEFTTPARLDTEGFPLVVREGKKVYDDCPEEELDLAELQVTSLWANRDRDHAGPWELMPHGTREQGGRERAMHWTYFYVGVLRGLRHPFN